MPPSLPTPRGPLTAALFGHWTQGSPLPLQEASPHRVGSALADRDALVDEDLHLALWSCYQLHYGGFAGVSDRHEWDTATLAFRAVLEDRFERALRAEHAAGALPDDAVAALREITTWAGPPLARTIESTGTIDRLREFAIHRSAYQLKEADPHTWAIPRLRGPGRAAMIEIQADEYGGGTPDQAHAELFADAMVDLGLSPEFGHYIDELPGVTLATDNLVSLFGLHRRLRGALVGHLALFEMCSVVPMSRYLAAARRIGGLPAVERFYEVHVDIDEHHAVVALDGMVAPIAAAEPALAPDIAFGAAALCRVEARFAAHVLDRWSRNESSLDRWSPPAPAAAGIEQQRTGGPRVPADVPAA